MAIKLFVEKLRMFLLRKKIGNERGLALILVLSLIVVIMAVIAEVIFQSEISSRVAVGERDKARAEVAALTGAQFAKMLIMLDTTLQSLPDQIKQIMGAQLGGLKFYSMLDNIPIGAEMFENIEMLGDKAKLFSAFDEELVTALKNVPGFFVIKTSDESSKLDVNVLNSPTYRDAMKESLLRLFSTPREAKFLEDKKFPPQRLVANLVDYIDKNKTDELDGSDEENQYTQLGFTHKPKNGPLESVEELRRIPGFNDDEIYNLFSPYLTVWPIVADDKTLNINTAPVELIAAISTKEGGEVNDPALDKLEDARADDQSFTDPQRGPTDFFDSMLNSGTTTTLQKKIAGVDSNVFRVEVTGVSNQVQRTYLMIFDRSKNKSLKNAPPVRIVHQRFM